MKERLMWENLFKCKLFPPHEPPSYARSSPTMRIQIRSIQKLLEYTYYPKPPMQLFQGDSYFMSSPGEVKYESPLNDCVGGCTTPGLLLFSFGKDKDPC